MKTAAGLALGSLQRSMILSSLRAPAAGVYLIQEVCDLGERVNAALLRRAWEIVAQRHEPLRCTIGFDGANPAWFRVCDHCDVEWREIGGQDVETYLDDDRARGFDFDRGIPMRFAIAGSTIIWTSHHALLDGRSYVNVWREWLIAYDALGRGEEFLPAQSASYAGMAPPPDPAAAEQYWRDCFAGISETTGYIVDRMRRSAADKERFARESASLSAASTAQVHRFASECGLSLNHIIKGAWALLLSRYSGRSEVVFGVTRAGREASHAGIGFFINTVPFRVSVTDVDVKSYLNEIRLRTSALREFENTPVEQIVEWSELPAGVPPFESVLVYERKTPQEAVREAGGRWSNVTLRRVQRSDAPITLAAFGSPELSIDLAFDARIFGRETMRSAARHLRTIIDSFATHPDARLHEANMLDEEERRTFHARNDVCVRAHPTELCAHQLFEQRVLRNPQAIAIDSGDDSLTYEELNRRANRIARHLQSCGAGAGDLIAIVMQPSTEAIAAVSGALKAGCAFLPLDPDLPPERLKAMLEDAKPKLVLRDGASPEDNCSDENLPSVAIPSNAAYVIYTSGSSGKPKAVVVPHRALVNHSLAAADAFGIDEKDRRLQFASIGTDVFVAEVFNYLSSGATLVLGWNRNGSVREFLRFIEDRRVTITGIPSAWWNEWVAALENENSIPPSLRAVIIGMEKASAASLRTWKKVIQGRIRLFNAYGPTETSPTATVYEEDSSVWEASSPVPIGKPLANTRVYVLDDHLNLVPDGIEGQLYIGGSGISKGYLNTPEETARRFVPDPFLRDPESRLYATGDIVFCLPDGNLVFSRRVDRQVKIRGFRVELDEIEARVQEHQGVRQCAVVLSETGTLAAYYTSRTTTPVDLRSFLSKTLPEHMIPTAFVQLPELPMTTGGKIDRRELALRNLPAPAAIHRALPLTLSEKRLAALWEEILQVTQVFAGDNFFELGGDSLQATRLITMIEEHFGIEIPMAALWRTPTLSRMAAMLDESSEEDVDPIVCLEKRGSRIPFFCFPGADENPYYLWHLARHLGADQPFYVLRDPRPMEKRGVYTVAEAAARLIPFLQSVQPAGPYIVGGHCYGGIVAFEVARQLLDRNEKVAMVVLLEVPAPGYPKVVRRWPQYLRASFELMRKPRAMFAEAAAHADLLKKLMRRKAIMTRRRGYIAAGLKSAVEPLEKFVNPNAMAGLSYSLRSVNCDVVQFIARDEHHSTRVLDDPRLAWKNHVGGRFSVVESPGEAGVFFRHPHASELAARLARALDLGNQSAREISPVEGPPPGRSGWHDELEGSSRPSRRQSAPEP